VTKFCRSKFGEVVPEGGATGAREAQLVADLTTRLRAYERIWTGWKCANPRQNCARSGSWAMNTCKMQHPWTTHQNRPRSAAAQIRLALNLIRFYAVLSRPFIPMLPKAPWRR
jgi:methionyl-tRNA synthetase